MMWGIVMIIVLMMTMTDGKMVMMKIRVKKKVVMMMDVKVTSFSPAYAEFSPHCHSQEEVILKSLGACVS